MLAIDRVCVFVLRFSHNNHFFIDTSEFSTARGCGLRQAKLSICGAEQLFSSSFLVIA